MYVYGSSEDSCDATAARWREANTVGAYLVLKAFAGFRSCSAQPDAWHQYSAALPEYDLAPDAFMIAPGFDEWGEGAARLTRVPERNGAQAGSRNRRSRNEPTEEDGAQERDHRRAVADFAQRHVSLTRPARRRLG